MSEKISNKQKINSLIVEKLVEINNIERNNWLLECEKTLLFKLLKE